MSDGRGYVVYVAICKVINEKIVKKYVESKNVNNSWCVVDVHYNFIAAIRKVYSKARDGEIPGILKETFGEESSLFE